MNRTLIRQAIVAALQSSTELSRLLAAHPSDRRLPAIHSAYPLSPPAYPCLTYALMAHTPDERFRPTTAEGGGEGTVYEGRLEIRAYSKGTVSGRDDITHAVIAALDGQGFALTDGTHLFRVELLQELPDQFDPALNAHYTLLRFRTRFTTD